VRHAQSDALDALEPLLAQLRKLPGLVERKRGSFYRGSSAFLHFHEDPAGFFADLKSGKEWERLRASTASERRTVLARARKLSSAK